MKLLSSRKLLVYLSKCASRTVRELASLTIQLQWTMQLWEVMCYFHCMQKKIVKISSFKVEKRSRKQKDRLFGHLHMS